MNRHKRKFVGSRYLNNIQQQKYISQKNDIKSRYKQPRIYLSTQKTCSLARKYVFRRVFYNVS